MQSLMPNRVDKRSVTAMSDFLGRPFGFHIQKDNMLRFLVLKLPFLSPKSSSCLVFVAPLWRT